jgi:hypothetical protein
VKAAKFLRDATIRRQPAGRKRGIGHEVDLVVGLEEWKHVEVKLVGAAFRAGSAFGAHCDDDDDDDVPSPANPADCSPGESDQGEAFVPDSKGDWSYLASLRVRLKF